MHKSGEACMREGRIGNEEKQFINYSHDKKVIEHKISVNL